MYLVLIDLKALFFINPVTITDVNPISLYLAVQTGGLGECEKRFGWFPSAPYICRVARQAGCEPLRKSYSC